LPLINFVLRPSANGRAEVARTSVWTALLIGSWFGLVAGLVEGIGLLAFQKLNWASWGPMLHVSSPILWISPLVDVALFSALAIFTIFVSRVIPKLNAVKAIVFILAFATVYDWLSLTGRLYHSSSFLLALGVAIGITRGLRDPETQAFPYWKKSLPMLAVLLFFVFVGLKAEHHWRERHHLANLPAAAPGLPNIVVIVIDTLRADHLSSYGYARATSPTMDRLAHEGVLFANAISTSSWSLPSHASLVTGQPVHEHGADNVKPMSLFGVDANNFRNYPTIGEKLERLGYRTAAFSANRTWFSHDLGFDRSFTHFEDYFHSLPDACIRTLYGREFSRVYLSRSDHSKPKRLLRWLGFDSVTDTDDEGVGNTGGSPGVRKRAAVVSNEFLDWIEPGPRPFLAFLNYFDVHQPYSGPASYNKPWPQGSALDDYDDGISYVDSSIAALMSALETRGLLRNTLVVITSDHGESLGQHGLDTHGAALYWESIHVPLILWWPGHVPQNLRVLDPVSNAAIPATLMTLAGGTVADVFPGPSLSTWWTHPAVNPPPVISELSARHFAKPKPGQDVPTRTADSGAMQSVVLGSWQLIKHEKYGNELYNWAQDPEEVHDVYDPSAPPPIR